MNEQEDIAGIEVYLVENEIHEARRYRPVQIVGQLRASLQRELDLAVEARNTERFARNFAAGGGTSRNPSPRGGIVGPLRKAGQPGEPRARLRGTLLILGVAESARGISSRAVSLPLTWHAPIKTTARAFTLFTAIPHCRLLITPAS